MLREPVRLGEQVRWFDEEVASDKQAEAHQTLCAQ
jgi:hypothetical protein